MDFPKMKFWLKISFVIVIVFFLVTILVLTLICTPVSGNWFVSNIYVAT